MNQEAQALADEIKRLAQQWALAEVRDTDDCATLGANLAAAIDRLAAMAQPPAGWVMVPVEPTEDMLIAAYAADREYQERMGVDRTISVGPYDHWCAMLSAAPKPEDKP